MTVSPSRAEDAGVASGRAATPADGGAVGAADNAHSSPGQRAVVDGATDSAASPAHPQGATRAPDAALGVDAGIAAAVRIVRDAWAEGVAGQGHCLIVAVDGPSGSGKTSLAGPLAAAVADALGGSVVIPQIRERRRGQSAGDGTTTGPGSAAQSVGTSRGRPRVAVVSTDLLATWQHPFDWWPILEEHLLQPLAAGSPAHLPTVTWVDGVPAEGGVLVVDDVDVLILEGVSSGRRAIADRLVALVWVEVPDATERLERAVGRDGQKSRPLLAQWQRDEERHFLEDGTRDRASVVIDPR